MTETESLNHTAVEVDGIRFETIVPNRVLSLPVKKSNSDGYTSVELGMKITNATPIPLYTEWISCGAFKPLTIQVRCVS